MSYKIVKKMNLDRHENHP